ncbi:hypothetical protein DICA3_D03180 [Diutina catenulata]
MTKTLPPTPPMTHRIVVGTIAVLAGIWLVKDAGKDFQWVKFTPHSPEEVERRKRENVPMSMSMTEERTLEYTTEARERLRKLVEQQQDKEQQQATSKK